jgi:hypothetical protein
MTCRRLRSICADLALLQEAAPMKRKKVWLAVLAQKYCSTNAEVEKPNGVAARKFYATDMNPQPPPDI